ncbi:uncharacterized protein [Anabrus simplex]|uniref:uncharacterized protein isoform X2 n=1 Tax=Anabrus simplex TaxID=316456 RepID=UPI0035A34110
MEEIPIKEEAVWLKEEKIDNDEGTAMEDPLEDTVVKTEPIKVEAVEIIQHAGDEFNSREENVDGNFVDFGDCQLWTKWLSSSANLICNRTVRMILWRTWRLKKKLKLHLWVQIFLRKERLSSPACLLPSLTTHVSAVFALSVTRCSRFHPY